MGLTKKGFKAFGFGILITAIVLFSLDETGAIQINSNHWLDNIFFFTAWSVLFSIPIYRIDYIKKHIRIVAVFISLFIILVVAIIIDSNSSTPDNPVSLIIISIFWLILTYLLFPKYFKKYKYLIITLHSLLLGFFFFAKLSTATFHIYISSIKEIVLIMMIVPIPIFIFLWIYEQWKELIELKNAKTNAELNLLKSQIEPHFFFNTLNNLYSLTISKSKEAPKVILKLSEMLRYTIYEGKKERSLLVDEVEYLKNFIDLHLIRYRKTVKIEFEHKVDENHEVAPLMFVVPLENAIKHGVETLSDNAYIKLSLKSDEKTIRYSIENNFEPKGVTDKIGIGLENLKQRLSLIYPKSHDFNILKEKNIFRLSITIYL